MDYRSLANWQQTKEQIYIAMLRYHKHQEISHELAMTIMAMIERVIHIKAKVQNSQKQDIRDDMLMTVLGKLHCWKPLYTKDGINSSASYLYRMCYNSYADYCRKCKTNKRRDDLSNEGYLDLMDEHLLETCRTDGGKRVNSNAVPTM